MKNIVFTLFIFNIYLVVAQNQEDYKKIPRYVKIGVGPSFHNLYDNSIASFSYSKIGVVALGEYAFTKSNKYHNVINFYFNKATLTHDFQSSSFNRSELKNLNVEFNYAHYRTVRINNSKANFFVGGIFTGSVSAYDLLEGKEYFGIIPENRIDLRITINIAAKLNYSFTKNLYLKQEIRYPLLALLSGSGGSWQPYHSLQENISFTVKGPWYVDFRNKTGIYKTFSSSFDMGLLYEFRYSDYKAPHHFQQGLHFLFLDFVLKL